MDSAFEAPGRALRLFLGSFPREGQGSLLEDGTHAIPAEVGARDLAGLDDRGRLVGQDGDDDVSELVGTDPFLAESAIGLETNPVVGEFGKHSKVDVILSEGHDVLAETQVLQPTSDVTHERAKRQPGKTPE